MGSPKQHLKQDTPVLLENREMTMYAVLSVSLSLNLLFVVVWLIGRAG